MTRFAPTLTAQIAAVGRRCAALLAVADYRERLHRGRAQRAADVAAQADARSHGGTR